MLFSKGAYNEMVRDILAIGYGIFFAILFDSVLSLIDNVYNSCIIDYNDDKSKWGVNVVNKEEIIEMIKSMPEGSTTEDIMEKLYIRTKIEHAMKQLDEGEGISHEEVKEHFKKWLS